MNNFVEISIGFDAREDFLDFRKTWDEYRIENYLLKLDIIKPLSIDVNVWHSVFHVLNLGIPDWIGPRQQLWDELVKLADHLRSSPVTIPYRIMAFSEVISAGEADRLQQIYKIDPPSISEQWKFLGYDVADHYLLSGLMDTRYSNADLDTLRDGWIDHLNEYHLFYDIDAAQRFKRLTESRVNEHSPFSIYGLYQINSFR